MQAPLGTPGDRDHARILALLASSECLADARLVAVVVSCLDEQPARVAGAGLCDRALPAFDVRAALGRDDPEEPRQQLWPPEASEVADLGAQPGGRERVDPSKAAQPGDQ